MATSNRGGNRGSRGKNNNPEGHNQYSSGWLDSARERPLTAAAAVGGAVAAGVFLWSRRNQISDQLSGLSEQIGEWRDGMTSDSDLETTGTGEGFMAQPGRRGGRKSQVEISEEALTLKETGNQRAKAGAIR